MTGVRVGWTLPVGVLMMALVPIQAMSQENRWTGETELGANLFFGNTQQTTVRTRGGIERADSVLELSTNASFSYGEATDNEGVEFVNKRSWQIGANGDFRPTARFTPFFFGTYESSFESRIDSRATGGAGAKVVFVRNDTRRVDLSLAILGERTQPLSVQGSTAAVTTRARWSMRFRWSRDWENVTFSTVTFYRPALGEISNFTMESESSFSFHLTDRSDLRISFLDKYDSGAEERGARTNNDGQLVLSLATAW